MLNVTLEDREADVVFVRWFNAPADDWNRDLNLRPLEWHRYLKGP